MSFRHYPFAAIIGQPALKTALLLAAVDHRLSVLLKGDKGSGKTTAARGLAEILPSGAPFINLPIGMTEDRLLGGLDLSRALQGDAQLKPGLVHAANDGVLYIDEVNLLSDSLTDALLDVVTSGVHRVERDGFSATADARFVLIGSMNSEEGGLRPQLLDRFALSLDVEAPTDPQDRAQIVESRMSFDADPEEFSSALEIEQNRLRQMIIRARALAAEIRPSSQIVQTIARLISETGARSLRADLACLRGAVAHAALDDRSEVTMEDVTSVLPLVLHHRVKHSPPSAPPRFEPKQRPNDSEISSGGDGSREELVFPPDARSAPELRVTAPHSSARGHSASVERSGNSSDLVNGEKDSSLNAAASFVKSFRSTGEAGLKASHLIFQEPRQKSGVRFIFVVDASGSHAAQQRMRAVKGVAAALLKSSVDSKDEVAVISFRGPKAELVLGPCRDAEAALRALDFLPTGGRTPLAHALDLAGTLASASSVVILITDGRANVPLFTSDPWQDALNAASKLSCASVLVDSSLNHTSSDMLPTLATAMKARLIHLEELGTEILLSIRSI